ncbi:Si-specific NAD(P)(+) transhydrogenase [Simkania negevensis]|uniref:Soluble pyridine nucleotide transhydrogenase n=1 Tax=Simkania negevensis TaxID=83561 RepID=A0ABS3ARA5_9BACT|nr:Si-specific NAD(P)(+) transhydrogenase [Simkania negevensis]
MEEISVDLVVIGTGPAGQKAAIQAAKLGKVVAIIEKDDHPGGSCLNSGTIPSKSLREAIIDLTRFHEQSFYGAELIHREVTISDLNFRLERVLSEEREVIRRHFRKNNILLLRGSASFEAKRNLLLVSGGEITHRIHAEYLIIATGSRPRNPTEVPFDSEVILDSTRFLAMDKIPKTLLVLGGGIIGSEYASFFAALGTEVTVIDKRLRMLPLLDEEISVHFQTELTSIGLRFVGNKNIVGIERIGDKARLSFDDGTTMEAEMLLYALGREANVEGLHIERAGLLLNRHGYIPVNAMFQTATSCIYAVGDVIGAPALASTGMEQGRLAARNAFGYKTRHFPDFYPVGIYTIPEISYCGKTEEELQRLGFRYEVGRAYYYELARGHISGATSGMFKILFHADTLAILGVHIVGRMATEVIHIGQMAMSFNAHIDYLVDQVFNYPTFAEGYRVAALNGLNKIKHVR